MGGANASRWVRIPVIGMSFQTSAFASLALLVWLAKWFSKPRKFRNSNIKWPLIMIGSTLALILPADFSTTAVILPCANDGHRWGAWHLWKVIAAGVAALGLFILIVMAFPNISNRVATWKARIVNFSGGGDEDGAYQTEQAKMAIAEGEVLARDLEKAFRRTSFRSPILILSSQLSPKNMA